MVDTIADNRGGRARLRPLARRTKSRAAESINAGERPRVIYLLKWASWSLYDKFDLVYFTDLDVDPMPAGMHSAASIGALWAQRTDRPPSKPGATCLGRPIAWRPSTRASFLRGRQN